MKYPYLLSDSQWEELSTYIEPKRRKRIYDLKLIVSAIVYVLRTGCQWRMLPSAYGKWQLVYYYFTKWMAYGMLEEALYKRVATLRKKQGRRAEPTAVVIDTQSVKTAAGVSEQSGYDANKKVKGRKRSLATATLGNPLAVGITTAGIHDKKAVLSIKEQVQDYSRIKAAFADGAFKGVPPFDAKGKLKWKVVNKKGGPFKILPKPWVVERTFSWLSNFRRLSKDYEKLTQSAKASILMAAIAITLNKLTTYF